MFVFLPNPKPVEITGFRGLLNLVKMPFNLEISTAHAMFDQRPTTTRGSVVVLPLVRKGETVLYTYLLKAGPLGGGPATVSKYADEM